MGQALRRFVARAPRYVLRPNDNQMLRFSPNNTSNRSFSTQLMNISETGLAFLIDRGHCPSIGEFIKVEFPVPGGEQIAWFGKVVRLEEFSRHPWWSDKRNSEHTGDVLVGIQFHQLPDGHRQAIRVHLQARFRELMKDRQMASWRQLGQFFNDNAWKMIMYVLSALFTIGILYFLSLPSPNYDSKRGAPWGQRFK
ncbi:MAG: PilZ domain-containing protein [Bdellovibrionales bacterium]